MSEYQLMELFAVVAAVFGIVGWIKYEGKANDYYTEVKKRDAEIADLKFELQVARRALALGKTSGE